MVMLLPLLAAISVTMPPIGAKADGAGHWTILSAPPAPITVKLPGPPPKTPAQLAAEKRFWDYARWQGAAMGQAHIVAKHLRTAEQGNFVDFRFEDNGKRFAVVYSFLRDGPGTLAKYRLRNDFVGETVPSRTELVRARDAAERLLAQEGVRSSGGVVNHGVEFELGITRATFEAMKARSGWRFPSMVRFTFAEKDLSDWNRALAADIDRGIRHLARATAKRGPVPSVPGFVKVELRDGCFRVGTDRNGRGTPGAHLVFAMGTNLVRDAEGYLAFRGGAEGESNARVGELATYAGLPTEVTDPAILGPLRAACGPGKVEQVGELTSAAAEGAQRRADDKHWTATMLREDYGLSERGTAAYFADCERRGVPCDFQPAPPPLVCPAGTRKDRGQNCRDARGLISPIPEYLKRFQAL